MTASESFPTSAPTLPTELWSLIFALSVPPPSFDEPATERQLALSRCARVCRAWRPIAERMLYAYPTLATAQQAEGFRRSLATEGGRMRRVKTLRVGRMWSVMDRDPQGVEFALSQMVAACGEGVEEVVVGKVEGVVVDEQLAGAQNLRDLHLCDSSLQYLSSAESSTAASKIPIISLFSLYNITHLTLSDIDPPSHFGGLWDFLKSFPNLTALAAIHSRRPYYYIPPTIRYLHALPLPTQLFGVEGADPQITEGELALGAVTKGQLNCGSPILGFSCTAEELRRRDGLKRLPPSLRFLRLTSGHFFGRDFLTPFLSSSSARNHLIKLEELVLPMRVSTGAAYEDLRAWARGNGVRVVWERDEEGMGTMWEGGFWECVRRWEGVVAREKETLRREEDGV
ncbi:hypothetical protein JCM6882_001675 [Rhodosporidiobolus microsporus]